MILYRYLKDFYIDALKDESFKVSRACEFDDKADCAIEIVGCPRKGFKTGDSRMDLLLATSPYEEGIRRRMEIIKDCNDMLRRAVRAYTNDEIADSFPTEMLFFLCFSDVANIEEVNKYMWASYGGEMSGVRFGFEVNGVSQDRDLLSKEVMIRKVRYVKKGSKGKQINANKLNSLKELHEKIIDQLFVKYCVDPDNTAAEYYKEREYRCCFAKGMSSLENRGMYYFIPFSALTGMKLVSIDIGYRVPKKDMNEIKSIVDRKWKNVKVSVVEQKNEIN